MEWKTTWNDPLTRYLARIMSGRHSYHEGETIQNHMPSLYSTCRRMLVEE